MSIDEAIVFLRHVERARSAAAAARSPGVPTPAQRDTTGEVGPVALGRALRDAVERAELERFDLEGDAFLAHLAGHLAFDAHLDAVLARLDVADLAWAIACARGERRAVGAFRSRFGAILADAARRSGDGVVHPDDVEQALLAQRGELPPRLAAYAGRGPLSAWVRVAATRITLDLRRAVRRHVPTSPDAFATLGDFAADPELRYLRAAHRDDFQRAISAAFGALTPRERNLLRMSLVDGVTLEDLAALHRVHRATVARWLAAARSRLRSDARKALRSGLRVSDSELDSLMRLVRSDLEVGILQHVAGEATV